jgi:FdhD protein
VRRPTTRVHVTAIGAAGVSRRPDRLVTEEPMEIRIHGPGETPRSVAVTLRTPGHDFELAVGFCVSEGLLREPDDLATVEYCVGPDASQEFNVVTITRRLPVGDELRPRPFAATASCGLCGKATLDDLAVRCAPVVGGPTVRWSVLAGLPATLGGNQTLFERTGGLHAAARFDAQGSPQCAREDVGRHNALDKLVGRGLLDRSLPFTDGVLLLSGRVSFELVQKAAVAGIPIIAAIGAPSSLAVETAERFGITVVGFLRDARANIYTHPHRVEHDG